MGKAIRPDFCPIVSARLNIKKEVVETTSGGRVARCAESACHHECRAEPSLGLGKACQDSVYGIEHLVLRRLHGHDPDVALAGPYGQPCVQRRGRLKGGRGRAGETTRNDSHHDGKTPVL